jgi:hypothetical protein
MQRANASRSIVGPLNRNGSLSLADARKHAARSRFTSASEETQGRSLASLSRLPGCRGCYAVGMPRSRNERQALEQERTELPEQIATYQRELDATPAENRERREMREWQIRRDKKRLAEIGARLAALPAE